MLDLIKRISVVFMAALILLFSLGMRMHTHICSSTQFSDVSLLISVEGLGMEDACPSCTNEDETDLATCTIPEEEEMDCCKKIASDLTVPVVPHFPSIKVNSEDCCSDSYASFELENLIRSNQILVKYANFELLEVVLAFTSNQLAQVQFEKKIVQYSGPPNTYSRSSLYLNHCVLLI